MIEREIGQTLYVESSDGPSEVLQPESVPSSVQFIVNNLNDGRGNMLITFADDIKLGMTGSMLEGSIRIQRALEKLDKWSK